jgi:hypothetical protein
MKAVTGPRATMMAAVAGGATATITLQPVAPKTVPPSNYPAGSTITGTTLSLGSVPARVWIEMHVTGWAPEELQSVQVRVDGTDLDGDGGGYYGTNATCAGVPVIGAGDITPASAPCSTNSDCRAAFSGITSPCEVGEPSTCSGPSGSRYCLWAFQNQCDPDWVGSGLGNFSACDTSTPNAGCGSNLNDAGATTLIDHAPSYLGTVVLDVPVDAKGNYVIDIHDMGETFMVNRNLPPNDVITIAAYNSAVIQVGRCDTNADCNDNDACTVDVCQGTCCANTPVAGWDPATECCNPPTGIQTLRPQSSDCLEGVCSLGGSSGTPGYVSRPDGTPCSNDPCYVEGQCSVGQCLSQQYAGSNCPKPRFISFDIDTGSTPVAYRVRMVSLHHPDPPYTGGPASDFSAFEGLYRWVGAPATYAESSANQTPVHAAFVGCDPYYRDWSAFDLLHVGGAEIVPSSVYEVQSIAEGLDINEEANYSAPITINTSRWCDVIIPFAPPGTTTQPDQSDNTALVVKFRSQPNAMSKPRASLAGVGGFGNPSLELDISFADIATLIDAYQGRPYPYAGPIPCP